MILYYKFFITLRKETRKYEMHIDQRLTNILHENYSNQEKVLT